MRNLASGTLSAQWLQQPERSNVLAIRFIVWVAVALGRPVACALLYPICWYFLLFSRRARRASRAYLRRALGREPRLRDQFRHYYYFAVTMLDRVFLLQQRHDLFQVTVHGEELMREALQSKQGCFLIGAHMGSFEILRAFGKERELCVRMVMYEQNARKLKSVLEALDPKLTAIVIETGQFNSMLKVEEALERGEFVGMLGDRSLGDERESRCVFFGEPASFTIAPFRMARMLKRPIILMLGLYAGGNRYELYFERLAADTGHAPRARRDALAHEWLQRYADRLEHYCRLAPYNWFNFYDFWQRPDADKAAR